MAGGIKGLARLWGLDLCHNCIVATGAELLEPSLLLLTALRSLDLSENVIGAMGTAALKKSLSACNPSLELRI